MKIVFIGLGTATFAALLTIRKNNRDAELIVIDRKSFDLQHNCGMPYAIEGKTSVEKLEHSIGAPLMKIQILSQCSATRIDANAKTVSYEGAQSGTVNYDKLILDLGSTPFFPPIEGLQPNDKVFVVHKTEDVRKISGIIPSSKTAVVIGGGAIGVESAHAIASKGVKVILLEALASLMPRSVDTEFSDMVAEEMKKVGVDLRFNQKIKKIEGTKIILENEELNCDFIVCGTGVRANSKLAQEAGLNTSRFGIVVDEHLQTSHPDIYAGGDCIEITNSLTGQKQPNALATTAYKHGIVIGENILGKEMKYPGTTNSFVSVIGDLEIASAGLNTQDATAAGFELAIGKSIATDKTSYMNDKDKTTVKILLDKKTHKVLGAQAVGVNAYVRIDVVSTAIRAGFTAEQLSAVEMVYCPPIAQAYDVLFVALDMAMRRL